MENNPFSALLRGPHSSALEKINAIIQRVMTAGYADLDIAVDDVMICVTDMRHHEGDAVEKKMKRLSRNSRPVPVTQITKKDVREYIDYRLRAEPIGVQVRQIISASKDLETLNQIGRRNMELMARLTARQAVLIQEVNDVASDLDGKIDKKRDDDIELLNAAPQQQQQQPPLVQALPPPPQILQNEEEGEGGDEAMEANGNEADIEARELGIGLIGEPNPEQQQLPSTEEALQEAWIAKKKDRINELEVQIKQLDKVQKIVEKGVRQNVLIIKAKREIFK